jgi:hypothetical protein
MYFLPIYIPSVNICSHTAQEGGVSIGPIVDAFVLDAIFNIFLGRQLSALSGSRDSVLLMESIQYVMICLLR